MSMRGHNAKKGTDLLIEHLRSLERQRPARREPLVRLSEELGERMATMLVTALAGDHGSRRRDLVA
ncbi:MAG: hypothetical protein ACYDA3_00055 [Gaiellaceae bacterium]